MAESQNIEYKESWRDEYLKWICGFANAQGGTIFIGVRDDGSIVGVKNAKKLLEDIPNKIQTGLGIIADVNMHTKNGLDYIEIKVEPSSFPISYHGEYHYRSGATKQQLTGIALSEFIMRKTGFRWEDVTVDNLSADDLDEESFKIFRREAFKSGRMKDTELNVSNAELLSKLHLISNGKLKRSAVLLFYSDPQIIQNGSYVKIGKFGEGADLQYQDVMDTSLITIADRIIDLIYMKYLKAKITYEHDRRVETYPYAREAVREAIYNAIAHNCYMFGTPIQVRIEDQEMIISNRCILPDGWISETLMEPHDSIPYNPDIANVFYRMGYIESWGRGIQKICDECIAIGADLPRYEVLGNGIRLHFNALQSALIDQTKDPKYQRDTLADTLADKIIALLTESPALTQEELAESVKVSVPSVKRAMKILSDSGRIVRVGGKRYGHWEVK